MAPRPAPRACQPGQHPHPGSARPGAPSRDGKEREAWGEAFMPACQQIPQSLFFKYQMVGSTQEPPSPIAAVRSCPPPRRAQGSVSPLKVPPHQPVLLCRGSRGQTFCRALGQRMDAWAPRRALPVPTPSIGGTRRDDPSPHARSRASGWEEDEEDWGRLAGYDPGGGSAPPAAAPHHPCSWQLSSTGSAQGGTKDAEQNVVLRDPMAEQTPQPALPLRAQGCEPRREPPWPAGARCTPPAPPIPPSLPPRRQLRWEQIETSGASGKTSNI